MFYFLNLFSFRLHCFISFQKYLLKAGAIGVEPISLVLETSILPLNYTPILVDGVGFEPTSSVLQTDAFTRLAYRPFTVERTGIEPVTRGFSVLCSTY